MTQLQTIENRMLRGSESWFVIGLAGFFAISAVLNLTGGAPDRLLIVADILAAVGLSLMFIGARTATRPVQRIGLVLSLAWFAMTITRWLT